MPGDHSNYHSEIMWSCMMVCTVGTLAPLSRWSQSLHRSLLTSVRSWVTDDDVDVFEDGQGIIDMEEVERHKVQTKYLIQFCTNAVDC